MAEQDFDINIRTVADLTGVRKAADAIEILNQQAKKSQAEAAGGAGAGGTGIGEHIERSFLRVALHTIGVGVVFEAINEVKKLAEEINKISESLDKQGEMMVKNVQAMASQTAFAQTQADVIKVAETGLKGTAEQHKIVEELLKKELGWWETISDVMAKLDPTLGPKIGPLQQQLNDAVASAQALEETQRRAALDNVVQSKLTADRRATESYAESVAELTARMKEQQALADTHFQQGDIASYAAAAANVERYRKALEALKEAHDKLTSKTEKYIEGADPQVKAILANEKAMFEARGQGRTRDADLLEKTAQALHRGATPDQEAELAKIYSSPALIDALNNNTQAVRNNTELWR